MKLIFAQPSLESSCMKQRCIAVLTWTAFSIIPQLLCKIQSALAGIGWPYPLKISFLRLSYSFQMDKGGQVRIRHDINHLEKHQKDLFKQYHILMRLLHVFETSHQADKNSFTFRYQQRLIQYSNVNPKCMFDCLVSFHANSCEHGIQFFLYWHRWLQSKLESYFLQAEKKLIQFTEEKLRIQAVRLYQIAKSKFSSPDQIAKKLWEVRSHYIEVWERLGKPRFIGAHYWNLMDFNNVINYPKGFKNREENKNYPEIIAADDLVEMVWEQDGIYEINLRTRYNYNFEVQNLQSASNISAVQQLIDNTNFWKNPTQEQWKKNEQSVKYLQNSLSNYVRLRQLQQRQAYRKQRESKKTYQILYNLRFNVLSENDVDYIFGGVNHPYYYDQQIQKYRRKEYFTSFDVAENKGQKSQQITPNKGNSNFIFLKQGRNSTIPYFTYGGNLKTVASQFLTEFSTTRSDMGENTMETLHNFGHVNQGYPLTDGSFSVMSPVFFAYHGFIDIILETKILDIKRQQPLFTPKIGEIQMKSDNKQEYAVQNVKQFLASPIPSEAHYRFKSFRWLWSQQVSERQNNRIIKFSDYPILQYSNRSTLQLREANWKDHLGQKYTYERLMLNDDKKTLRDSYDLKKVRYDVESSGFLKNCIKMYNQSRNVYTVKQKTFSVQLSVKRQGLINESFFVRLIWNNMVIAQKYIAFFEKGQDCPNCGTKQTKQITIHFPIYLLKKYLKNIDKNVGKKIKVQTTALSKIKGKIVYNKQAAKLLIPLEYQKGWLYLYLQQEDPITKKVVQHEKQFNLSKIQQVGNKNTLFLIDQNLANYKRFRYLLTQVKGGKTGLDGMISIQTGESWIQMQIIKNLPIPTKSNAPKIVKSFGPAEEHSKEREVIVEKIVKINQEIQPEIVKSLGPAEEHSKEREVIVEKIVERIVEIQPEQKQFKEQKEEEEEEEEEVELNLLCLEDFKSKQE